MERFSYENEGKGLEFTMTHKFVENCYVLYGLAPTFFFTAAVLMGVSIIWVSMVFGFRKQSVFPI